MFIYTHCLFIMVSVIECKMFCVLFCSFWALGHSNAEQNEILPDLYNQTEASAICIRKGGYIPEISIKSEIKAVSKKYNNTWTDLRKLSYQAPRWIDGSTTGKFSF